jgi:hypothetical protein
MKRFIYLLLIVGLVLLALSFYTFFRPPKAEGQAPSVQINQGAQSSAGGGDALSIHGELIPALTTAGYLHWNGTALEWVTIAGGAGGTVTNVGVSNNAGNFFSTGVTNPTTNAQLQLGLQGAPQNTYFGSITNSAPSYLTFPSCSGANDALAYTTGTGLSCHTITTAAGMTWPGAAGIAHYSGSSSWDTSYSATNQIPGNFISTLNQSTTGNAATATALAGTPTQCTAGQFAVGITATGSANCSALPAGFTAGGDLSGTATSQQVVGIHGNAVPATPGTASYLHWTGSAFAWDAPTPVSSLPWNSHTDPTGPLSLNMGISLTTLTWNFGSTSNVPAFYLADTAGSTGTNNAVATFRARSAGTSPLNVYVGVATRGFQVLGGTGDIYMMGGAKLMGPMTLMAANGSGIANATSLATDAGGDIIPGSSFTAGGDLTGTLSSQQVHGLAGNTLPALASGYLHWTGSALAWDAPSAGITSINGDTTAAQTIVQGTGISVATTAGATTITNTAPATTANFTGPAPAGWTVAGATAGGFPYFPNATTMASSAAIPANQLLVSGGASSPPTGIGTSPAWNWRVPCFNGTTGTWGASGAGGTPTNNTVMLYDSTQCLNASGMTIVAGTGLFTMGGSNSAVPLTMRSHTDANQTATYGGFILRPGDNTGVGTAVPNSISKLFVIRGSNSQVQTDGAQAGSIGIYAGGYTGAVSAISGRASNGFRQTGQSFYHRTATVTPWALQCLSIATEETTQDCGATPAYILGVAQTANNGDFSTASSILVIQDGEVPVLCPGGCAIGHTVCAGATAGAVTDSGGTLACTTGFTVGVVNRISGTYYLPDNINPPTTGTTVANAGGTVANLSATEPSIILLGRK